MWKTSEPLRPVPQPCRQLRPSMWETVAPIARTYSKRFKQSVPLTAAQLLLLSTVFFPPSLPQNQASTIGEIRIASAKASGADRDEKGWKVDGTCKTHGADEKYEFIFDRQF